MYVFITNKAGIELEVPLDIAEKFIKLGDITEYKTVEGDIITWEKEFIPEKPVKRKSVTRKLKPNK